LLPLDFISVRRSFQEEMARLAGVDYFEVQQPPTAGIATYDQHHGLTAVVVR